MDRDYKKELEKCDEILRKNLKTLKDKVDIYMNNKDFENALICLNQISQIDPDDLSVKIDIVGAKMNCKNFFDAISLAEKLPDDCLEKYVYSAFSYEMLKQKEDAYENYLKAYKLFPDSVDAISALANFYYFEDQIDKAEELFNKILEIDENDVGALSKLSAIALGDFRYLDVIEYGNRILEVTDGSDVEIYPTIAFAYVGLDDADNAFKCFVEGIEANPESGYLFCMFGGFFITGGNLEEAEKCFKKAHELDPYDATLYYFETMQYKGIGEIEKAKECFERLLELDRETDLTFDDI